MQIENLIQAIFAEQGSALVIASASSAPLGKLVTDTEVRHFDYAVRNPALSECRFLLVGSPLEENPTVSAVIIQGQALWTSPLELLNLAADTLPPGATLVLYFTAESVPTDLSTRKRHLNVLVALATRCGFDFDDRSEAAASPPLIVYFRKRARRPRWRLDLLHTRDLAGFSVLFKAAFNTEISESLWRWKYGDDRGVGVIARRGESIIAHYGATRRRALLFDREISVLQMCDVMVDPRERGVMTKHGAFFLTTATILELYLGLQCVDLAFGFPNGRAVKVGERLGLYAQVGRIMEVRWSTLPNRPRLFTRARTLQAVRAEATVQALWLAMRHDLRDAIVVIRDWSYLKYRYLDHPEKRYELFVVTSRLTGKARGLMVMRRSGEAAELLDFIGPLDNIPTILDQARRIAGIWGSNSLFCWITQQHLWRFATPGASIKDPDVIIPTNAWVDGPSAKELADTWWLMSGDTEFH